MASRKSIPAVHVWQPVSAKPLTWCVANAFFLLPCHFTPSFSCAARIIVASTGRYGDWEGVFGTNSSPFHSICGWPNFPSRFTDIANTLSADSSSRRLNRARCFLRRAFLAARLTASRFFFCSDENPNSKRVHQMQMIPRPQRQSLALRLPPPAPLLPPPQLLIFHIPLKNAP